MTRRCTHFAGCSFLAVALAACGAAGDDTDAFASTTDAPASTTDAPDPTGGTTDAAACVEDDLAPLPFAGPGWDGEAGAPTEPLQDEYVASTTVLLLRPGMLQDFLATAEAMYPELVANPGLVGYSLARSDRCGTARTLAVWRDEAAMMQFVASEAHVAGLLRADEFSTAGAVTSWKLPRAEVPVPWEAAIARATAAMSSY